MKKFVSVLIICIFSLNSCQEDVPEVVEEEVLASRSVVVSFSTIYDSENSTLIEKQLA